MLTIFLAVNSIPLYQAFSACGAESFSMIFYDFENSAYSLFVNGNYSFLSLLFNEYEVALKKGLQIVRNHTLLLS